MKEARYRRIHVYDFTYIDNKNRQVPAVGGGDTDDTLGGADSAHVSFLIQVLVPFRMCLTCGNH